MMNSIRHAPVDVASTRILNYIRTHNYEDCAIYINRLNSNTFRKILYNDLSIDVLLAQLPFSIEIFDVVYSKIFIHNPDTFPIRILKPEQIISRMISVYASSITEKSRRTSIVSSTSKNKDIPMDDERLASSLSSILRVVSYVQPILFKRLLRQKQILDQCIIFFEQHHTNSMTISNFRKSSSITSFIQKNLHDTLRHELESTITCCQQALHRLEKTSVTSTTPISTPNNNRKRSSISTINMPNSLDEVQNRLYQHKSILNLVEPYLARTKLNTVMDNIEHKISIDKQILLAYSHIKTHEKQLNHIEPLLPLFKRFAFAYERIIQLWRRVTDSTLIDECTDDIVIDDTTVRDTGGIGFERARSQEPRSCRNQYEAELHYYKDDMAVRNNRSIPLQALSNNGRDQRGRLITNGTILHSQTTSIIPSATSLQSLSPVTQAGNVILSTNPISDVEQQQIGTNNDLDEKEKLKNDLQQLKIELQKSKETIARLQKSEEQMRERLAEQAQRQLEKGGKFEDLNQISRPTELIRSYNSLYSQARIDTLDALDNIPEMSHADDLKSKLLFSVVVLAFRYSQTHAKDIRNRIKQILQLTNDKSSLVLEDTIEKYLRSTILKYDVTKIAFEVENQLWNTLYDYPTLKTCQELLKYTSSACRTAWGLVNQTPAYYIEFQALKFDKQIHERFHTSDNESDTIIEYVWPCLFDGRDRTCVAKGVVITDERYLSMSKNVSS